MHWRIHIAAFIKNGGREWELIQAKGLVQDLKQEVFIAELTCQTPEEEFRQVRNACRKLLGFTRSKRVWYNPQPILEAEEQLLLDRLQEEYTLLGKRVFTEIHCPPNINQHTFAKWASQSFKCADNSYRSSNAAKQKGVKRK